MSNIYQHGFDNCLTMRLSNSEYWDLFLCYDCKDAPNPDIILTGSCLLINIDIDDDNSYSGDTLYNLVDWTGSTVYGSGVTLNDIGLTGIDNGFINFDCSASTSGSTFLSAFTGSTLFLSSGDTRFSMSAVSGCTYDYSITPLTGLTEGRYSRLCGGFYQGFFKLSDKTYFKDITNNKFTWPISWFNCPPVCTGTTSGTTTGSTSGSTSCCPDPNKAYQCYLEEKPIPYNYQVLPTRYEQGWTSMFWLRKDGGDVCSGNTATTLNDIYSGNTGFFYYMGTRSENKFWDLFSGETGYTTSSGYPLPPPKETEEVLDNNPFLVYKGGCCCFTGITEVTTQQKDRNIDIVNNALGFRIKDDGSIGYRTLGISGVCSAVTATTVVNCDSQCGCGCNSDTGNTKVTATTVTEKYVTGVTITEEYSLSGMVKDDQWTHISIRFRAYEEYGDCELNNIPRRLGSLDIFVNGFLKWTVDNFDEFLFKELDEYREKQEGVPFNYSWGGGTQGLIETNTVNGPDVKDGDLVIQENFAGTFKGDVATFKMYGCVLDVTLIRYEFEKTKSRFGLAEGEVIYIDDIAVDIDFYATFYPGSIVVHYIAKTKQPLVESITFDFTNEVGVISGGTIVIEDTIYIPKGGTSGSTIVTLDDDYERLSDDYVVSTFNYKSNKKMSIKRNDIVKYNKPVKSFTADIPGQTLPTKGESIIEQIGEGNGNSGNGNSGNGNSGNQSETPEIQRYKYYYGKSTQFNVDVSDIINLLDTYKTEVVNNHIELPEGNGYGYIIIPINMTQPTMFRNSENGCNGFAIPMLYQGEISIGEPNNDIMYKMYRTYVPTHAKVDVWLCE